MKRLIVLLVFGAVLTQAPPTYFDRALQPTVADAQVTNPTAVRFANEKIRPAANRMASDYIWCKQVVAEWTALGGTSLIPNTSATVEDGATTDGRPVITGAMVSNIINRCNERISDFEAASNAKRNTVFQVATNAQSSP